MALILKPGRVFRHRGGSLLEAAIVLPVLMYVAFGTVEFGYYFYVKHALDGAAREGARAGIVSGSTYANITSAVSTYMSAATLSNSGYTTVVQDNGSTVSSMSSAVTGDAITVTVSCNWGTVGSGYQVWNFIGITKTVVGVAVMRHE